MLKPLQHCQKLAPELNKVATGMDPLVPFYAVDCDAESNKPLCAQQVRYVLLGTLHALTLRLHC